MRKPLSVSLVCNPMFRLDPDMINILYTQEPDGEVLVYQSYANRYDRQRAYDYLLDKGYEIVGEE